jgi:hypothetical protein
MARQRGMGQGIKSCKNLNAWRHFFRPNSASALQGEIECDIYWGRSANDNGVKNVETTRSNLDERVAPAGPIVFDEGGKEISPKFLSVGYAPSEQQTSTEKEARNRTVKFFAFVIIAVLAIKFASK